MISKEYLKSLNDTIAELEKQKQMIEFALRVLNEEQSRCASEILQITFDSKLNQVK